MLEKIEKKTNFLNRIGNFILAYTRCIIYKTIVNIIYKMNHFEYCATLLINLGKT